MNACFSLQIVQNNQNLDMYKNGFVNLALPFFGFSEPIGPAKSKYYETEFSLWDRFDVKGDRKLGSFLEYFEVILLNVVDRIYELFAEKLQIGNYYDVSRYCHVVLFLFATRKTKAKIGNDVSHDFIDFRKLIKDGYFIFILFLIL